MVRLLDLPSALLGLAAFGAWVLAWKIENNDGPHPSRFVAPCLCASWVGSKVCAAAIGWQETYDIFPWVDLIILIVVLTCWHFWRAQWLMVQAFVLLTKLVWDALYLTQTQKHVTVPHNAFVFFGNCLFAVEIACVATPGGTHLGRDVRDWVSHRRLARHRLGLSRRGSPQNPET